MNIEERRIVVEPIEVLEDVPLGESNLEKFTRIGTSMEGKTRSHSIPQEEHGCFCLELRRHA